MIRLHFSNRLGTKAITLGPVHIAEHAKGSSIKAGTDHVVTFGGQTTVSIAKGADVISDAVSFSVSPLDELAVSFYVPGKTGDVTAHNVGNQMAFITTKGDATALVAMPEGEISSSRFLLTGIDVSAPITSRAIVVIGDSITDGVGSTPDLNTRWVDVFAERLQGDKAMASIAVLNGGIAGNRILHDGRTPFLGPSALSRFDRDALDKPGVRYVLLLEGINDIGAASTFAGSADDVTEKQIIDGMKLLIKRAHEKNKLIFGATLMPVAGVEWPYHSSAGEAKRQAINAWIRSSGAFDGVVDFDQVMRDPTHPDHLLSAFDSGDHLHPNDAGHKAMAAAINMQALLKRP
ncbi:SGNH/GDSL hydrolase family protein [Dyella sp. 20L07]|uniref:SGNH/GDSL hydrolase family protein n=1 Tax=Dyella sp. 20L07 TaxID=3384240 RepID=UPI003D2C9E5E